MTKKEVLLRSMRGYLWSRQGKFGIRDSLIYKSRQRAGGSKAYSQAAARVVTEDETGRPSHDIKPAEPGARLKALHQAKPFSAFLTDTFDRQHDYLRISITERCNLRCLYCMPEEGVPLSPKKHLLTTPEILYLAQLFISQGVTKIRLTGGEPTIHPEILPLLRDIGALRSRGLKELALTTNGLTLPRKLDAMIAAGVTGINLSLDTLDPFQFEIMTRRRGFDQVMKSIDMILASRKAGAKLKLKVNIVVIRGLNDAQVLPFVEFTKDRDLEVRFIEYMPFDGNRWSSQKMFTYQEMLEMIRTQHATIAKVQDHANDTSKTYQIPGYEGRIGFITSMTDHFCGTCNRLRITSDGNLKVCLFGNAEVSLRDMLRNNFNNGEPIDQEAWEAMRQIEMAHQAQGRDDASLRPEELELLNVIGQAVKRKKAKHAGIGQLEHMKNRPMILIDRDHSSQAPNANIAFTSRLATHPCTLPSMPSSVMSNRSFVPVAKVASISQQRLYATKSSGGPKPNNSTTYPSPIPSLTQPSTQNTLTHLTTNNTVHMVTLDPSKPTTQRTATARATILFSNPTPLRLIREASLKKGDVSAIARIAGIMAAKRTSDHIPLCHNIPLSGVTVDVLAVSRDEFREWKADDGKDVLDADVGGSGGVVIEATVRCNGTTGVEMEALSAVTAAGLTVYDMCKAVDKGMRMEGVRVVRKSGGRSGDIVEGQAVAA